MAHQTLLIDAGTGNLRSVYHALITRGFDIKVSDDPSDIKTGERIILPGVGAFGKFMQGLRLRKLDIPLKEAFARGDCILGICVGMQALFEYGEEGGALAGDDQGLGLIPGKVPRFPNQAGLKVPHTGWNQIFFQKTSPLFTGLEDGCYGYFNHSYYCEPKNPEFTIGVTDYGISFTSVVQCGNLYGVQFHPEKSQLVGLRILENFMKIV